MQFKCGKLATTTLLTLVTVVLLAGVCSVAGAAEEPTLAPENPAFLDYLQAPDLYQMDSVGPFTPGLVPEPFLLPDGGTVSFNDVPLYGLPTTYDLRTTGKLTPIRNQGSCGSCWTFGTMGSLESSLMPGESLDFSENNLKNLSGFDLGPCSGGNRTMSVSYLARWAGPISESADPYSATGTTSPAGLSPVKHVQDVIYLPTRSSALDNDSIKQAVMTYGAVYTTYYHSDAYYNSSTRSYYCGSSIQANHAVCIVGWDDSYSRSNFASAPAGDGAFIIRNSWGTYWGQAGYFYMSYYDYTLGKSENAVFTAEPVTNYSDIYQYDTLGWISNSGYGSSTAWFANVFTARANTSIAAASWYTAAPNSTYELYVYTNPSSGPASGTLMSSKSGTIATAGYHTVPLDVTVPVSSGQKFSVVVKAYVPGYSYPIPLERPMSGYASKATASAGQSYMSSNGSTWSDVASSYANTNVCLKAFTAGTSTPPPPTDGALSVFPSTGLSASGNAGGPFSPSSQSYTLTNTGGTAINWTASNLQAWVSLSATSGTLAAGASTTVMVSINSGANSLAVGSYSDTVSFVNATNGSGNTSRTVSLTANSAPTPAALEVTPSDGFSSSGPVRGPFSPTSKTYTIKNTGSSTLSYRVSRTKSWLSVSSTSGTLYAGASKTITVSINYYAGYYAAGTYTDTVTFANATNGTGNTTRNVTLQVGSSTPNPGALSVSPSTGLSSSGSVGGPFSPTSQSYTLTNTGGSSISWTASKAQSWVSLSATNGTLAAGTSTTVTVSVNSGANSLAAGSYSDTVSFGNTTNGSGNTSRTVSLTVNSGGTPPPPSGGYVAVAAPFGWIDPSAHTKLAMTTNSASTAQAMPFSFGFYGKSYNSVYVGSNGLLGFTSAGLYNYNNTPIPYRYTPNNAIYPYWDNINPSNGGAVYIGVEGTAPYRKVVVSWVNVPHDSSSTTRFTFQAVLEETTNDIYFQYQSVGGTGTYGGGRSASIGVEDEYGTGGLQYSYNTYGKVTDNSAIRITTHP